MAKKNRNREDIERKEPTVLPAREAMSIISPATSTGFVPDLSAVPDAEEAARTAATDAQASGSGEESVTAEDRDEHFESHDSASSQT
jgi:hypothetical protein